MNRVCPLLIALPYLLVVQVVGYFEVRVFPRAPTTIRATPRQAPARVKLHVLECGDHLVLHPHLELVVVRHLADVGIGWLRGGWGILGGVRYATNDQGRHASRYQSMFEWFHLIVF
ncbi:MAG: hypothetical protein HN996_05230 [Opitutae bacterium]|nr:hypothetical protein [Opitutae bacterium]